MICIPAAGRTRSSLVAGIFVACGAWCGVDTFSHAGNYRTYENADVIDFLNTRIPIRSLTQDKMGEFAQTVKKIVSSFETDGRVVMLKYDYYFDPIFRKAFPEAPFYFVGRKDYPREPSNYENYLHWMKQREGTWISSDRVNDRDFSEIRPIIESHGLDWNEEAVESVFKGASYEKDQRTFSV